MKFKMGDKVFFLWGGKGRRGEVVGYISCAFKRERLLISQFDYLYSRLPPIGNQYTILFSNQGDDDTVDMIWESELYPTREALVTALFESEGV